MMQRQKAKKKAISKPTANPARAQTKRKIIKIYHKEDPTQPNTYRLVWDIIQKQRWLFRGTNTKVYEEQKRKGAYYTFFDEGNTSAYLTFAVQSITEAMAMGISNCPQSGNGTRPLLLAIDASGYEKKSYPEEIVDFSGQRHRNQKNEMGKIEIREKISFENIVPITSLEQLNNFLEKTNNQKDADREALKREFQKHYFIV